VVRAMEPDDFKITRSASIKGPKEKVFEQINDFHKWDGWSPSAKIDPNMQTVYSGPSTGAGSSYSWVGNNDVGEGKMTVLESHPPEHIKIELEFIKPFAAKNVTEFMLKQNGDATDVTWTMAGKNNFVAKAFSLLMNMDKLVGNDFEKGLAEMKKLAESEPKAAN